MKKIIILGASGSVGSQTIDVIKQHPQQFKIVGISIGKNLSFLRNFLNDYQVEYCCVKNEEDYITLKNEYPSIKFFWGDEGLIQITSIENVDLIMNALQGFVGLKPTLNAIEHHINVAMANKEALVAAGNIIMEKAKENNVSILPVDSEHSAIFQCLHYQNKNEVKNLIITASGGSFKNLTREQLKDVTVEQALNHPRWHMGKKITIDSATMINKGFEVIEAHVLFDIDYDKIKVLIHPESIVHSMVEYRDHSIIAQLGCADMRLPIQYSLSYPQRLDNNSEELSLSQVCQLNFKEMDYERYPIMNLVYKVARMGGNYLAILNGANQKAVELFLDKKISFLDIETLLNTIIEQSQDKYIENPTLEQIIETNDWAIEETERLASLL